MIDSSSCATASAKTCCAKEGLNIVAHNGMNRRARTLAMGAKVEWREKESF